MQKKGKMFVETLKNNVSEIVNHFNSMVIRAVPKIYYFTYDTIADYYSLIE